MSHLATPLIRPATRKGHYFLIEYKYRKQGWMWSRFDAASLIYVLRLCVGVYVLKQTKRHGHKAGK